MNDIVLVDMVIPSFKKFLKKHYPNEDVDRFGKSFYLRRGKIRNEFESWLWLHGAVIRQKNKKQFLEFINGDKASFFILKYLS